MQSAPRTSVIIPVHNEEALLADTCRGVLQAMASWPGAIELVLVENGSSDNTFQLAAELAVAHPEVVVFQESIADYGNAVRRGLLEARGEWSVVFDCDLWDATFAAAAITMMEQQQDVAVVVASKTHPESSDERSAFRRLGTFVFTKLVQTMCGLSVSDTHGMKVFATNRAAPALNACKLISHVFDTELIVRLERSGFKAGELPCSVRELRPARSSYLSRVPSALHDVWKLRRLLASEARAASSRTEHFFNKG
jgi:glycosyltransferase involved in cell wall biosynthesis